MSINLNAYKKGNAYLELIEYLIKKANNPNRDLYLESIDISPSTFKRCKTGESNRSNSIYNIVSSKLGYKVCSHEFLDKLEIRLNEIYHNVYYKIEEYYLTDL